MKKGFLQILLIVFSCFFFSSSFADKYWIKTTASNWNNAANWSNSSGGAGNAGVPTAGEKVFLTGLVLQMETAPWMLQHPTWGSLE